MAKSDKKVRLKVHRQDGGELPETRRWEEFEIPWQPQMNVISALMEVQKSPVTTQGKTVAPVVWECVCLEEVCGSCTMVINGKVRQSCTALVDQIAPNGETITLARCMTCGCCLEACPQINDSSKFIGPAAISQVRLFNLHPSGKMHAKERLEALMGEGGIADCGKAQNCVEVCP